MNYNNKVVWIFKNPPYYIITVQDSQGKLLAIEIEEYEPKDQTEYFTND
jgi:hypothetical protein